MDSNFYRNLISLNGRSNISYKNQRVMYWQPKNRWFGGVEPTRREIRATIEHVRLINGNRLERRTRSVAFIGEVLIKGERYIAVGIGERSTNWDGSDSTLSPRTPKFWTAKELLEDAPSVPVSSMISNRTTIFCTYCGTELNATFKFCDQCGTAVVLR